MDNMSAAVETVEGVVEEIMRMHKTLPARPDIEEVVAAKAVIKDIEREHQLKLDAINRQTKGKAVPEELFSLYLEMQRNLANFQSREQKKDAVELLDLENAHQMFDELIQRASQCVSPGNAASSSSSSSKAQAIQDGEKISLIKLASLIEVSAIKGTGEIILSGKLSDQVEWLPDSIGKLSRLITLDLSENRISALPVTIGGLTSLSKLDLHANRITELPESIGELLNLISLDLRGNNLVKLPLSLGRLIRLEELDMSSNNLSTLPDTIGCLTNLKILNVETNNLDELPHTIGQCSSLEELRVDYNRLKALPEAVGKIESLTVLTVRYNNIRQLPTTMSSLVKLRELDVSFNELEAVPESLCFAVALVKLNVSNNFADLRSLPRSIGNLEMLEVLDISNNQIRFLPDSFGMLSRLNVLYADQNPLEVPPRQIVDKGAQVVVQYMADLVANRDVKTQPIKQKTTWAQLCCFSQSNKRKRSSVDYAKT